TASTTTVEISHATSSEGVVSRARARPGEPNPLATRRSSQLGWRRHTSVATALHTLPRSTSGGAPSHSWPVVCMSLITNLPPPPAGHRGPPAAFAEPDGPGSSQSPPARPSTQPPLPPTGPRHTTAATFPGRARPEGPMRPPRSPSPVATAPPRSDPRRRPYPLPQQRAVPAPPAFSLGGARTGPPGVDQPPTATRRPSNGVGSRPPPATPQERSLATCP